MTSRRRDTGLALALALGLLGLGLAVTACGGNDEPSAGTGAGKGAGKEGGGGGATSAARAAAPVPPDPSPIRPDDRPFSDDPAGPAWDACAWAPLGEKGHVRTFDPSRVRDDPLPYLGSGVWHDAVEARRTWLRDLGLPEEALGVVIAIEEPLRCFVVAWKGAKGAAATALRAKGLVAEPLADGAQGFAREAGGEFAAVLVGDHVLFGLWSRDAVVSILDVHAGRAKSLRDAPGMREACAGAPKALPATINAGKALRRRSASEPPSPIASVERVAQGEPASAVQAMVFESVATRDEVRAWFERIWPRRPRAAANQLFLLGGRDRMLRLTMEGTRLDSDGDDRRVARELLTSLEGALAQYKNRRGALPSASRGLAALADEPELLDDVLGRVPSDPWKRPYLYEPAHPKRPDAYVLRSLGPDGEIDTEDDVFPPKAPGG